MDTETPLRLSASAKPGDADQLMVMRVVNRVAGGTVHPYVAYDPLRDVEQNGRALQTVRDAVSEFGCIGVKVYPPMGFQAWGNTDLPFWKPEEGDDQWRPTLGEELDARLRELYMFCLEQDVPILCHSNATVLSRSDYADRPNPKHWGQLLENSGIPGIENLRILMGHFGGFGDENPNPKKPKDFKENARIRAWVAEIARLCVKFPNVYADLSYHEGILEGDSRRQYVRELKGLVSGAGHPMKRKLCYGSDWVMLARQPDNELYRNVMEEVVSKDVGMAPDEVADVMGHNALRFLGITDGGKNKARLEAFYAAQGMEEPWWFEEAKKLSP